MSKQNEVDQNAANPLFLRSPINGGSSDNEHRDNDQNLLNLMRWGGRYDPTRESYLKNEVVKDGDWTMISLEDNTERPAPQPSGSPSYDLPDAPGFADNLFSGVVQSGHDYTFTKSGFLQRAEVWCPDLGADVNYQFVVADITDPANPLAQVIPEPVLNLNDWTILRTAQYPLPAGTVLRFYIDALNSGANTVVSGGWTRTANSNTVADPGNQSWNTQNNEAVFRINKTDADGTDRTAELATIGAGSRVVITDTQDNTRSMEWSVNGDPTDQGTYYQWAAVAYVGDGTNGEPVVGNVCTITATVPVPAPTKYSRIAGGAPTPDWATVEGYKRYDGVEQAVPNDAHGVRLFFQPASVPKYWDFLSWQG